MQWVKCIAIKALAAEETVLQYSLLYCDRVLG